jgi:predicted TPR repeat methyltransferase
VVADPNLSFWIFMKKRYDHKEFAYEELIASGRQALEGGNLDAAREFAERAITLTPRNGVGHALLAEVYLAQGDVLKAERAWRSALSRRRDVTSWWAKYAVVCIKLQHFENAEKALEVALKDERLAPSWWAKYAVICIKLQHFENAEKALKVALKDERLAPSWWVRLAEVQKRLGNMAGALHAYQRAIELDPTQRKWVLAHEELTKMMAKGERGRGESEEASSAYYDEIYKSEDEYHLASEESVYKEMWDRVCELILAFGVERVMDVGCGPGQFAEYLLSRAKVSYTGLDFSPEAIRIAQSKGLAAQFSVADIYTTPLISDGDYDVLIGLEVLEHLSQDIEFVRRIPSGKLIICSVPSFISFGHVRSFASTDEIAARYGLHMSGFSAYTFSFNNESLFLFYGRMR